MPGKTWPGGVREQTHIILVRPAETMLWGGCPGGADRRRSGGGERASPWATSQHGLRSLHGSMTTVSDQAYYVQLWKKIVCRYILFSTQHCWEKKLKRNFYWMLITFSFGPTAFLCVAEWHFVDTSPPFPAYFVIQVTVLSKSHLTLSLINTFDYLLQWQVIVKPVSLHTALSFHGPSLGQTANERLYTVAKDVTEHTQKLIEYTTRQQFNINVIFMLTCTCYQLK